VQTAFYQYNRILRDEKQPDAPGKGIKADKPEGTQLQAYPSERDHALVKAI
jgi:hypothetical protein